MVLFNQSKSSFDVFPLNMYRSVVKLDKGKQYKHIQVPRGANSNVTTLFHILHLVY